MQVKDSNAHEPYYIVICGLPAVLYFSKFSRKRYDFRKKGKFI